jgi:hypothetical protein
MMITPGISSAKVEISLIFSSIFFFSSSSFIGRYPRLGFLNPKYKNRWEFSMIEHVKGKIAGSKKGLAGANPYFLISLYIGNVLS